METRGQIASDNLPQRPQCQLLAPGGGHADPEGHAAALRPRSVLEDTTRHRICVTTLPQVSPNTSF